MEERKTLNLYQRILGVMSELNYIGKGDKLVAGQYKYVSHDQVSAKIHPLLVSWGIVVVPNIESYKQEGNRTEVVLKVVFVNADDLTQHVGINLLGYGIDSGDKGPGKAISYAYKYALLKMFCLETGDDPDHDQDARYEAPACMEFEGLLPEKMTLSEKLNLKRYLAYCADVSKKHIEDVKRQACTRMPEFLTTFRAWQKKVTQELAAEMEH